MGLSRLFFFFFPPSSGWEIEDPHSFIHGKLFHILSLQVKHTCSDKWIGNYKATYLLLLQFLQGTFKKGKNNTADQNF